MEENIVDSSTASGVGFLMGLWLISAPFLLGYSGGTAEWNDVVLGFVIGGIGLIRMIIPERDTNWMSWFSALLGLWLVVSPFVLGYRSPSPLLNDIVLGVVITTMSLWSIETATSKNMYA